MILELDLPLKEIKQLLDCEIDRENTLIQQRILLEQKVERFKGLIQTINSSIKSAKEGVDVDMENMFKGYDEDMIRYLREGFPANDPEVFERVKEHLSILEKMGHPSTSQDFLNQTEFFFVDDFHRNML